MSANIHDVARRAGVSISTVSRVLNDTAKVNEEKRARVVEAAAELNYTPNLAARRLLSRSTGGIGVLLPFITGEFFSRLIDGVDEMAHEHGLFLMVSATHRSPDEFERLLREAGSRTDGLIVMATDIEPEALADLLPKEAPVVLLNTQPASDGIFADHALDEVRFDNYGGAYAVGEHFVEQGFQRFAVVRGPEKAYDADERVRGFFDALRDHDLDADETPVFEGDFSQEMGYQLGKQIATLDPLPHAVFASNDLGAVGVVLGLHEAGLHVPSDLAVAGFDDVPMARYTLPPLTTASVPVREIGARAAELLIRRIRRMAEGDPPETERVVIPVELVRRASTNVE